MSYITPAEEISQYLLDNGVVLNGQHFTPYAPEWAVLSPSVNVISQCSEIAIVPNPRWLRDEITMAFNVRGRTRDHIEETYNKSWEIHNFLLGRDLFQVNNNIYMRILASNSPTMSAMGNNTDIFVSFILNMIREGQVAEGNRDPLP
jgi:hypothetical protein